MSQGNFFALDRRAWAMVCALGMPSAAAYLVLGCFSGRDNRSTHASVHAVETYTAISRGRSRQAIEKLKAAGAIRQTASGAKPAYELLSVPEIPALAKDAPRCEEMTDSQRRIYELVQNGQQPSGRQRQSANSLVRKGWLSCDSDIFHLNEACEAWLKPDWIWLPKTIVTGAGNETPPVERARQTADVMTMRLFIDLYHAQNLREDGGVDRWCVFGRFERKKIGQRAQYDVWGFENMCLHARQTGPAECHYRAEGENRATDFFRRLDQLKGLGLLEWVPHLFESDDADAESIHPCGMGLTDSIEDRLGALAHEAGQALLTEGQILKAEDEDLHLVPVLRHIANVQMIGIARLRYRPQTQLTSAWWAELHKKCESYLQKYQKLANG